MIILNKTNWTKAKCAENWKFHQKHESLTAGNEYFCKIGKFDMPVVISDEGIEVHLSEPFFKRIFDNFEIKKENGRG